MAPNKPFGTDYSDPRTPGEKARERLEVVKQAASLTARATDNTHVQKAVTKLRARRAQNPDALKIDLLPQATGLDLPIASEQLLIRQRELTGGNLGKLLSRGITPGPATGSLIRLTVPDIATPDVSAFARTVTATDEVEVLINHVVPLGVWAKGEGGPEPSAGSRPFPAVEYPQQAPPPIVAVLDSGVSSQVRTDGYLAMPVASEHRDPLDVFPAPAGDGLLDACAGHGGFAAGIVQQVAPTTPVLIYRVADSDGVTTDFEVAAAMRLAVQHGATILNLSLGTETPNNTPPPALADVIAELAQTRPDVLIVCAAGNGGTSRKVWPAAFAETMDNVVAVAGLEPDGDPAPWSSHGPWVTCSTIGEGVMSTYVEGTEDGVLIGDPHPDTFVPPNPWAVWSGTSFTAPQIAGAVARICTAEGLTPAKALAELEARATPAAAGSLYGWTVEILPGT
ncbi:hypothetical protein BJF78_27980 [Pseudonocardia sp. CNS-139]|nr:hypothetical protein BJF78_27980 [Pseudonocardia sp. CNS-139]